MQRVHPQLILRETSAEPYHIDLYDGVGPAGVLLDVPIAGGASAVWAGPELELMMWVRHYAIRCMYPGPWYAQWTAPTSTGNSTT